MTSGLHHVTAITRRVQQNVDFYAGFLGLRLVKQAGGAEDAQQLHLFYGDAEGTPGSVVTFLVWQDGAPGRVGHGQVAEITLAVPPQGIGTWLQRALAARVPVEGPLREFGESVLRLRDPDGIIVKLVGVDMPAAAALPDPEAPTRLRAVTLYSEKPEATAEGLARFGYRPARREGAVLRLVSDSDAVDLRDAAGFFAGIPGTGTFDHVAFRAADDAALEATQRHFAALGPTTIHDRTWFRSLYLRDPAGLLIEQATDGPGFAVDEDPAHLGERLMFPGQSPDRAEALRLMLPQFSRPGEERPPMRDLPFVHRLHHPEDPDGSVLLLLHGTGGTEADLMPLAHQLAPRATLLGVRGRATEEGVTRWFRRLAMARFDQDDIRAEARAFDAFLDGALGGYGLDPARLTVLGYSNGANFAGAVMALHPGVIRRAILLRPMLVLEDLPKPDLTGLEVLTLSGDRDPYGAYAPALNDWLAAQGATLEARQLSAGHELGAADLDIARDWLATLRA
ncbi:VOC family protein [Salipiger manganoxidans]|uniref:VOC family protein n=1 Tax=Salipiger marinus TaxID=555512 RepID=UPI001E5955FE|nr:VOC family protein [Salipiger manganoxidans]MCD1620260.1 VOC family protein [Salipiger manganoxidans]